MESKPTPKRPKDQLRDVLRLKRYSYRTEQAQVGWMTRYVLFHDKRHPKDVGIPKVEACLTHLAVEEHVTASTQNQAFSACYSSAARCCAGISDQWTPCAPDAPGACPPS